MACFQTTYGDFFISVADHATGVPISSCASTPCEGAKPLTIYDAVTASCSTNSFVIDTIGPNSTRGAVTVTCAQSCDSTYTYAENVLSVCLPSASALCEELAPLCPSTFQSSVVLADAWYATIEETKFEETKFDAHLASATCAGASIYRYYTLYI